MLLTGASRGIGHATVKRFSARGLARHHLLAPSLPGELSLGDGPGGPPPGRSRGSPRTRIRGDRGGAERLAAEGGLLHALVNNAGISPKGRRASAWAPPRRRWTDWQAGVPGERLRTDPARPRALTTSCTRAKGSIVNVTSIAGSRVHPFAGAGLRHLEGGARRRSPARWRPISARSACASTRSRPARSTPRSSRPAPRSSSSRSRCAVSAPRTRSPRRSTSCAPMPSSYVTGAELHINGGQHV